MRVQENAEPLAAQSPNVDSTGNLKKQIVTPILSTKKFPKKKTSFNMTHASDEFSGGQNTPHRLTHRVSFVDDAGSDFSRTLGYAPELHHRRNFSVQFATDRSRKLQPGHHHQSPFNNKVNNGRALSIPPFIPDDPEKPHLSSWKRERERRE